MYTDSQKCRGEEPKVEGNDTGKGRRVHGASREAQAAPKSERHFESQETCGYGLEWESFWRKWQGKVRILLLEDMSILLLT